MDVGLLAEELTCQQVMLRSLDHETHDGVDEERDELRAEIARLRGLLARAKQGTSVANNNDTNSVPDSDPVDPSTRE